MKKGSKKKRMSGMNRTLLLLALPAIVCMIMFNYIPFIGNIVAFKRYNYVDGIFGSPWVGLDNFRAIFELDTIWQLALKTIAYRMGWVVLINIGFAIIIALFLYEVQNKKANKLFQSCTILPNFITFSAISYILFTLLSHENGILNSILTSLGMEEIMWYNEPKYWPLILTLVEMWKMGGMAALYFYSVLLNIDPGLYEAAAMDGAGKFRQMWHISLPEMKPMIITILLLNIGSIFGLGWTAFYSLTLDSKALYPTTDILSTYLYRGLRGNDIGFTTAVDLCQSVIGLILLLASDALVKRRDKQQGIL